MKNINIYLFFAIFVAELTIINSIAVAKNNSVVASWYQAGRKTASGQRFDPNGNTVAHRTLPFGTKLKLTNPNNGRSIIATVNDRGPFIRGTGLDVARGGAQRLGFINKGKTKLIMQVMR
jgi:rare lipoprotein A